MNATPSSRTPKSPTVALRVLAVGAVLLLSACAATPPVTQRDNASAYYKDDGPGDRRASEFLDAPDALPRDEPVAVANTRPYTIFNRRYVPATERRAFEQRGVASWYGRKFHGLTTANGERYDMYAMTAAHPTLPLPSYVRVTNLGNGRSVVVRVNDRGPFLHGRIIDLSFAAAAKLGYADVGTAEVSVEVVDPIVVAGRGSSGTGVSGSRPPNNVAPNPPDGVTLADNAALMRALDPARPRPAAGTARQAQGQSLADPVGAIAAAAQAREPVTVYPVGTAPSPATGIVISVQQVDSDRPAGVELPPPERAPVVQSQAPVELGPVERVRNAVPDLDPMAAQSLRPELVEPARLFLQLGAYATRSAADNALAASGDALTWLQQPLRILEDRGLFKLQTGPFESTEAAQEAASRIRGASGFSPFYVYR